MTPSSARSIALSLVVVVAPSLLVAQASPTPTVVTPALDFSGIIFGSFSYRTDSAARATLGGKSPTQFGLDRAYLNFRMPAGENTQIRITPDVFQNTNASTNGFYQGWVVRIKYGYVQYTGLRNQFGNGSNLAGRIGILQTTVVEHMESFWPRYLGNAAVERHGYFASADAGAAGLLTLGRKWGEIYGTITNGNGYTTFDRDRFKDLGVRVSLTPFANRDSANAILKTFTITPWFYKGWSGSTFAAGGANQVGPGTNGAITDGLQRDRFGIFAGVKERRLTLTADVSRRVDAGDAGGNTAASPRVVRDSTGQLLSSLIIARPMEWFSSARSNFSFLARFDHFTPAIDPFGPNYAGTTPFYRFWVVGASYDVTQRFTFTLNWQAQSPSNFPAPTGTNVRPTPRFSTVFLHWVATF
jgi:hypothetical protein